MAFEPVYDYFKADHLKGIGAQQIGTTCKLTALNDEDIDRVLSVVASATITGGEALSGEARYNGVATFKVMYVTASGVEYASYDAEFSGAVADGAVTPRTSPIFTCRVLDTSLGEVTKREINVSAAIEVQLSAVAENEVKYLSAVSDGLYTREEETCYTTVSAVKKQSFTVNVECEVKDVLKGVLLSTADGIVQNASTGLDCFVIDGEVYVAVSYRTSQDECSVKTVNMTLPFKEELEAPGAMVGQRLAARCSTKGIKVTAEVDEEMGKTKIFVEMDLVLFGVSYAEEKLLTVCDVFSPAYTLGVEYAGFTCRYLADVLSGTEKISGAFELEAGNDIDKVLDVASNSAVVTNCYYQNGRVMVEGIVTSCTLCTREDKIKSIGIETPFSVALSADANAEGAEFTATAAVSRANARHKKTNEIDLAIELELRVDVMAEKSGNVISSVEVSGEKQPATCAMQVYVPRSGATLWDVSKELSVQPDLVMSQNPSLKFPLTGAERVLIYRQNKVKF